MTEPPTMKEKRELIKNTYLAHTHSDEGGRYGKVAPTNVIGSSPVSYPRLPSTSPWSAPDPSGQEQPYPIDLSDPPEPVGTAQEIQDSLQPFSWLRGDRSSTSASPVCAGDDDVVATPTSLGHSSPTSLSKSRATSEKEGGVNTNGEREGAPPSRSKLIRRLV